MAESPNQTVSGEPLDLAELRQEIIGVDALIKTPFGQRLMLYADYTASVWDLTEQESAGTVSADVSGTSYLPALVVPIPLIARTQAAACKGLANQLRSFINNEEPT